MTRNQEEKIYKATAIMSLKFEIFNCANIAGAEKEAKELMRDFINCDPYSDMTLESIEVKEDW